MKAFVLGVATVALAGCSTTGYRDYLTAQHAVTELSLKEQKPLVRIEAQPGQPITGLAKIEVYAPQAVQQIQQERPNEWVGVANTGLGVVGSALGIKLGGDAAIGLAGAVGQAANNGYQFVNPTPVVAPEVQVVRPEVVQAPVQVVQPEVVQVPTQVVNPVIVPAGGQ